MAPSPHPNPLGTAMKGSRPRSPYINHEVPHKNTNRDRKKGMNSTLFVRTTSLMMDKGEAYMQMEKMVAAKPQKSFLFWPWSGMREMITTMAKTESANVRSATIFNFSFLGAYTRKMVTYKTSITAPTPLIVLTRILFGEMNGSPYQAERRQLSKVAMYGTPEKSSVDLLFTILLNVIVGAKKRNRPFAFPKIPNKKWKKCNAFISSDQEHRKAEYPDR